MISKNILGQNTIVFAVLQLIVLTMAVEIRDQRLARQTAALASETGLGVAPKIETILQRDSTLKVKAFDN